MAEESIKKSGTSTVFINQQKLINYKEISKRQFRSTKIYANWLNVLIKRVVVQQFPLQRNVSRLKMAINYEVKCVVDEVVLICCPRAQTFLR